MIEPKDASKCDERQVKKKSKPLTKKKEGERQIMSTQGMKTWKLGLFFVVSLMLMAGVLAENTFGHDVGARGTNLATNSMGTLRVDASNVNANEEVDLTITYTATETIADPTDLGEPTTPDDVVEVTSEGRIQIALPSGWGATDADGLRGLTRVTAHNGAIIKKVDDDDGTPVNFTTSSDGTTIVVDLTKMETGDYIKVVIKGSELADFTDGSLTGSITVLADGTLATFTADDPATPDTNEFVYTEISLSTLTTGNAHGPGRHTGDVDRFGELSLDLAKLGNVRLTASKVTAGEKIDLTVTYTSTETMGETAGLSGVIRVMLPTGWDSGADDETVTTVLSLLELDASSGVVAEELRATDIALDGGANSDQVIIDIFVTKMAANRNVKLMIKGLQTTVTNTVADYIVGVVSDRYESIATTLEPDPPAHLPKSITNDGKLSLKKPELGNVMVSPPTVTAEDTIKLMVTYTASADLTMLASSSGAGDAGYGIIQVELPDDWTTTEDDVTVTHASSVALNATTPLSVVDGTTIVVGVDSLAQGKFVKVTVDKLKVPDFSDIETGDVFYAQVMVYSDQVTTDGATELTTLSEAHLPVKAQFKPKVAATEMSEAELTTGSDDHPTVTVNRRYRGSIIVTEGSVAAESMVDLKVRYIATDDLAMRDTDATATDDMDSTYGRIQITLPGGWGPESSSNIFLKRQTDDRDATYLSVAKTSSVQREDLTTEGSIDGGQSEGWTFYIDVNAMRRSQYVELTIHNLMIGPREVTGRADADNDLVQVMVYSDQYTDKDARDTATDLVSPGAHSPVKVKPEIKAEDGGSDMQPTVTVTPKVLGAVTVSKDAVTAGSDENDFKITYTATEPLGDDSVIEVQLPAWGEPTPYQFNDDPIPAADDKGPYVKLGGSASRLAKGTEIEVNGNVVRIILGDRGLSRNGTVVLEYKNVTVQRTLNTDGVPVKVFSSDSDDRGEPQYPVKEQVKDIIKVNRAADGSGMVVFEFDSETVEPSGKSNTAASVPAGLVKDDAKDLIVKYQPVGDMVGDSGAAEFEIRLPSGWEAVAVRASVSDSDVDVEGNTINVDLRDHFGEDVSHELEITLESITVPNDHGDDRFVAKSRNSGGSFEPLDAKAFVGNTLADADTMAVKITPAAAYEDEEDVDFEITLTANGPMHDSDIKITMPEGISGLQTDPKRSSESNYVRKVSASVSGVEVRVEDSDDENILIKTGKLNKGGQIRVSLSNVDIDGVSTEADMGFRVFTRTRGTDDDADADADTKDMENLTGVEYALIVKDNLPNNDGAR